MLDFDIGDMVYLEDISIVGIVTDVFKFDDEEVDVEVQWIDGERYWCLANGLTIISKSNPTSLE